MILVLLSLTGFVTPAEIILVISDIKLKKSIKKNPLNMHSNCISRIGGYNMEVQTKFKNKNH